MEDTRQARLLAELDRFEATTGYSRFDISGVTKQKIKIIERGANVANILSNKELWLHLLSAGVDLHYVIFGETWAVRAERDKRLTHTGAVARHSADSAR